MSMDDYKSESYSGIRLNVDASILMPHFDRNEYIDVKSRDRNLFQIVSRIS